VVEKRGPAVISEKTPQKAMDTLAEEMDERHGPPGARGRGQVRPMPLAPAANIFESKPSDPFEPP